MAHTQEKVAAAARLRGLALVAERSWLEKLAALIPDSLVEEKFLQEILDPPKGEVTPFGSILSQAERIAMGGMAAAPVPNGGTEEKRLIPLLETVSLDANETSPADPLGSCQYRLRSAPLSRETLFPLKKEEKPDESDIFARFAAALEKVPHRAFPDLWLSHTESLLLRYFSSFPAITGNREPVDIPLYDHIRATTAMACSLYQYHQDGGRFTAESIGKTDTKKFLLVSGDFQGIQSFIFKEGGESRKFRSKLLRGRSFQVSLFTELVAHRLCEAAGMGVQTVLMKAGGKFILVFPNTEKAALAVQTVKQEVADWFLAATNGEAGMVFSVLEAAPEAFFSGKMGDVWETLHRKMGAEKYKRLDMGAVCGRRGAPFASAPPCLYCNTGPRDSLVLEGGCRICQDQKWLGESIIKTGGIRITRGSGKLGVPFLERYQLTIEADPARVKATAEDLMIWQFSLPDSEEDPMVTLQFINGYAPQYTEEDAKRASGTGDSDEIVAGTPKHFQSIAEASRPLSGDGTCPAALGVLKADIDQLGLLFGCGMRKERFCLSRLTALSRQVDLFFSLWLPEFLASERPFQDVYTVFAGGDDLFLIGPWRQIITLASRLETEFSRYTGENPAVHFSCGITLEAFHIPVNLLAKRAEAALERAKHLGGNRISLFGKTVLWEEFKNLHGLEQTLSGWLAGKDPVMKTGMLYRLVKLAEMAEAEQRLGADAGAAVQIGEMSCLSWRSKLAYTVHRNVGKKWAAILHDKLTTAMVMHGGNLMIPLQILLYERRRRG